MSNDFKDSFEKLIYQGKDQSNFTPLENIPIQTAREIYLRNQYQFLKDQIYKVFPMSLKLLAHDEAHSLIKEFLISYSTTEWDIYQYIRQFSNFLSKQKISEELKGLFEIESTVNKVALLPQKSGFLYIQEALKPTTTLVASPYGQFVEVPRVSFETYSGNSLEIDGDSIKLHIMRSKDHSVQIMPIIDYSMSLLIALETPSQIQEILDLAPNDQRTPLKTHLESLVRNHQILGIQPVESTKN